MQSNPTTQQGEKAMPFEYRKNQYDEHVLDFDGDTTGITHEEAWKITLAKWAITLGLLATNKPLFHNGGWTTCGLCHLYNSTQRTPEEAECERCPIYKTVNKRHCQGTPYAELKSTRDLTLDLAIREMYFLLKVYLTEQNTKP